jgi:diguanylate cyclase
MTDGIVALHLHGGQSHAEALPHLERLLDLIGDALLEPVEGSDPEGLHAKIVAYREALHGGNPTTLQSCGDELLRACGAAVERHKKHRASMRAEIADLLALFRDVTLSVAGEGQAFTTEMHESAARFSALGQISDVRLLKERLQREVVRLRDTAKAGEQRWQAVVKSFKDRVEQLEEQLLTTQQEASLDALTGVANRRLFDRTLKDLLKDGTRRFALVLIDVDDFKTVNDQRGHEAGDRVLQAIAHTFATSVRSEDMVARIGGDEFAVILENVTLAQATSRVTGIATRLATASPDGEPSIRVSCGVAEFSAGDTSQSLTKRADEALYDAKRQGKGRVAQKAAPLIRDLRRSDMRR